MHVFYHCGGLLIKPESEEEREQIHAFKAMLESPKNGSDFVRVRRRGLGDEGDDKQINEPPLCGGEGAAEPVS